MFSCEIYEVFKNTYFEEHLRWLLLNILSNALAMSVSQYSYITENEWTHLILFRFTFSLLLKKNTLAGLSKHMQQKPLNK